MRSLVPFLAGLLVAAVVVGCGPRRPHASVVTGKVTYKEQPVGGAALLLYPANAAPEAMPLTFPVDQDGNYRISDVPTGDYKIVIQGTAGSGEADLSHVAPDKRAEVKEKLDRMRTPATIPFPKKYQDLKTTPLKCTITDKDQHQDLTLEG